MKTMKSKTRIAVSKAVAAFKAEFCNGDNQPSSPRIDAATTTAATATATAVAPAPMWGGDLSLIHI